MTEKNYGGASPHGFKAKGNLINNSNISNPVEKKKMKMEVSETEMSEEVIQNYLKAGAIVSTIRKELKDFVKPGVSLLEIAEKIEDRIVELGGAVAFPVNTSIDEIAAHYTPVIGDTSVASGLLKIDFGVEVGGFIADNAMSFDFSEDGRHKEMLVMADKVLNEVLGKLEIGSPVKIIGNTIAEMVEKDGRFKIIKNLSGHSVEEDSIHAGLTIANTPNENNTALRDIAIAIEPFLTTGKGEIYEGKPSEIYVFQQNKTPRDRDARKLLEFINENYRTKPFCKRWLMKSGLQKINFALSMLIRDGIVHNFPVLVEKDKKPVAQSEHTVLFADKKYVTTF